MRESRDQLSRICVLLPFATFAFAVVYVGLWNIRQLVKISPSGSRSPDPNVFLVSSLIKSLVVSKCLVCMLLQDE